MTGLDWIVLGIVILLALFGWAQGFVSGALALVGFVIGAWVGTRVGPLVLPDGADSGWAPAFGLIGALVAGAVLAMGFEGIGARLRARVRTPAAAALDGVLGAVLTACMGLGVVWVLGAVALGSGGELRQAVQRSYVLQRLNTILPPTSGLSTRSRTSIRSRASTGPRCACRRRPGGSSTTRRSTPRRAASSRCSAPPAASASRGRAGWPARGSWSRTRTWSRARRTRACCWRATSPASTPRPSHFDPRNDVAVLRVPGLQAPALPLAASPRAGTSAAVLGFPRNGPYDERAGRLGATRDVVTQDAYGRGPVRRSITSLRGAVRSGNSGGPMVDGRGRVVTTIFAATTSGPRGGYGVPNAVVRSALGDSSGPVSTGPCA